MSAVAADLNTEPGRSARYARCVQMSKKTEWQIDRDLMRGRTFDFSRKSRHATRATAPLCPCDPVDN